MSGYFAQSFKGETTMLRTLAIALAASLVFGGAAHAAEERGAHVQCKAFAKIKAEFDAQTHAVPLTSGQFHFIAGVYVGSPSTPDGMPPGDGAILVTHDGAKDGIVIWTRGPLACAPIPVNEKLIKLLASVRTGDGEDGDSL
jgi:hypothetical protein